MIKASTCMLSLHWCALSIVLLYNNATCTMKDTLMFLAIFVQVCGCMACNCYPRWLPSLLLWVAVHCALFVLCVVSYTVSICTWMCAACAQNAGCLYDVNTLPFAVVLHFCFTFLCTIVLYAKWVFLRSVCCCFVLLFRAAFALVTAR